MNRGNWLPRPSYSELTVWPPSTVITLPVMKLPASDASSSSAPSRCSGWPMRRCGNALDQLLAARRLPEGAVHLGLDIAGADRVDADAVARPFHGERARQMDEPGLRRVVGRHLADRAQAQDRGDVDDAARPLVGHPALGRALRHQPGAAQVGVDDGVPVLLRHLERGLHDRDAGVVDDDVDRPSASRRRAPHSTDLADCTSRSTAFAVILPFASSACRDCSRSARRAAITTDAPAAPRQRAKCVPGPTRRR